MTAAPPLAVAGQEVVAGPERAGSERRWRLRLPDGKRAVVAQLLPELARDDALRRRYVRDAERMRDTPIAGLAAVLAIGPDPDPRDPAADAPWRLREDPEGETLEAWLAARAPAPVDEALAITARLCGVLENVHVAGAVLRDFQPRQIVYTSGALVIVDVGLARVDILSTRTASSLLLEGSPYSAPEHLRATRVDARADLYTVGVILWRALTGTLPFGDGPAILRERTPLPAIDRPGVPAGLDDLLRRLLAEKPEERPDSAREVAAALRGEPASPRALEMVVCQACGAVLRAGLRLCMKCGREAVQFERAAGPGGGWAVVLRSVTDDATCLVPLRRTLETLVEGDLLRLNFMTEDRRMYSKEETSTLIKLPVKLFDGLTAVSAGQIVDRMQRLGIQVHAADVPALRKTRKDGGIVIAAGGALAVASVAVMSLWMTAVGAALVLAGGLIWLMNRDNAGAAILRLRRAPAALPAADSLLARIGALLGADTPGDVREQVTEIALQVQRLVAHRGEHLGARAEIDAVTGPVEPLVALLEKQAAALAALDEELDGLNEETMLRALAASEARGEPRSMREPILAGLDRLRTLEDQRSAHMFRLLEVSSLLRRAVEIGLRVGDPESIQRQQLALAIAALEA